MTELETLLLKALSDLQNEFSKQHESYQNEQNALREMFKQTQHQNALLSQQLDRLNEQLSRLNNG